MRLFIAIDFANHKDYFNELQDKLPEDTENIAKLTKVNTFHLTLKFLGEVDEEKIPEIKKALEPIKFKPFKVETASLGFFPSEAYIKVVWVGFNDSKELMDLQKQIEDSLEQFHFRKDFEFAPHLTLARVRFVKNKEKFLEKIKQIKVEKREETIDNFKLIKSTLTPEGPIYENIEIFS